MRECVYCRRFVVHPCHPIYPWWSSWWLCQTCLGLSNDLVCLGSMVCLGWMAWLDCLAPCCHPVFLCLECRLDRLGHRCLVFPDLECRSDHPDPLVLDRPDLDLVFPDQGCQLDHPVLDLPDLGPAFRIRNVGWDVVVGDGDDAIFLGDGGGESCRHVDLDDAPAVTNRQFFPESGPVVAVAQRDRIAPWLAVAIELDGDRISTRAAVVDRPFFVGADLCGFLGGKDRRKRCQI